MSDPIVTVRPRRILATMDHFMMGMFGIAGLIAHRINHYDFCERCQKEDRERKEKSGEQA